MLDIIDRFTQPGDLIFDPFVGGGSTAVAALELNCRFIGMDVNQDCIDKTLHRISAFMRSSTHCSYAIVKEACNA